MRIQRFNARLLVLSLSETACLRDAHCAATTERDADERDGDESERCGLRDTDHEVSSALRRRTREIISDDEPGDIAPLIPCKEHLYFLRKMKEAALTAIDVDLMTLTTIGNPRLGEHRNQ